MQEQVVNRVSIVKVQAWTKDQHNPTRQSVLCKKAFVSQILDEHSRLRLASR